MKTSSKHPGSHPAHLAATDRWSRRMFLKGAAALGAASLIPASLSPTLAGSAPKRKMTIWLSAGAIGVRADQLEAIDLAHRHGFESVDPFGDYLASLSKEQLEDLLASIKVKGLVFGAAGLPVDFRGDDARFREGLGKLPRIADGLRRAGVDRLGTWISPGHATLTYYQNFNRHAQRLGEVARILREHGQRLGLEYVGTKTLRARSRYPFIHSLAETQDLIGAIGTGNVGVILDSWHWWQADETEEDLLALSNEEVVAADLNDAPAGIPKDQQQDNRRELPAATGVIDAAAFLNALNRIGFDGPVRAEPFNQELNALDHDQACAATIAAMRKAFALID
jgi:sugar phosphate isomerase/epimerase